MGRWTAWGVVVSGQPMSPGPRCSINLFVVTVLLRAGSSLSLNFLGLAWVLPHARGISCAKCECCVTSLLEPVPPLTCWLLSQFIGLTLQFFCGSSAYLEPYPLAQRPALLPSSCLFPPVACSLDSLLTDPTVHGVKCPVRLTVHLQT